MSTIGLYVGVKTDDTRQLHYKQPWDKYLNNHTVEAFGSSKLPDKIRYDQRVFTTPRKPNGAISRIYSAVRDCQEYLSQNNPDVLLQLMRHQTYAPSVALVGNIYNVPVITRYAGDDFHSYQIKDGINKMLTWAFSNLAGRTILRYSDKIICLGPYTQNLLTNRGYSEDDTVIVPVCIDMSRNFTTNPDQTNVQATLDIAKGNPTIFYAGRLTKSKGMEFLKKVIDKSISVNSDLAFILAGRGPYRHSLESRYSEEQVYFPGHVNHMNIHSYYKHSDVYIHPSPYEGLPLSIIESLSCGTPVIARRAGDIPFVTPNIVETPSQMADRIINKQWSSEWKNKDQFRNQVIRRKIDKIITELT